MVKQMTQKYTTGMDEVGTGCFAGPAVLAFVRAIDQHPALVNMKTRGYLNDSKKLSKTKRGAAALELHKLIQAKEIEAKILEISVQDINQHNIYQAQILGYNQLIKQIPINESIIIDGVLPLTSNDHQITMMVKADTKILQVMAASIIAKEYRDALMRKAHEQYPQYEWISNVGYGTPAHIAAIKKFGTCPMHRANWKLPQKEK